MGILGGILFLAMFITAGHSVSLVEQLEQTTGLLVRTLVKSHDLLQNSVKEEIDIAHDFANSALHLAVNKLAVGANTENQSELKAKMREPFAEILEADRECTDKGLVVVANRVVRIVETYQKVHAILDLMNICGDPVGNILFEVCERNIAKAADATDQIETMIAKTMDEIDEVAEIISSCIIRKYNQILNNIEDLTDAYN